MKKVLLSIVFLLMSIISFSEVPHSYVTENPDKIVTQTETLKKYKEKAELNLSITKLKSKEIDGMERDYLVMVDLEENEEIKKDNIIITQDPMSKEDEVNFKIENNILIISEYEENKDIYIKVLDSNKDIKSIYKVIKYKIQTLEYSTPSNMYFEISDTYKGGKFIFTRYLQANQNLQPIGIKVITPNPGRREKFFSKGSCDSKFYLNGKLLKRARCSIQHGNEGNLQFEEQIVNISDTLIVKLKTESPGSSDDFSTCEIEFIKYPKSEFTLTFTKEGRIGDGTSGSLGRTNNFHFKFKPESIDGTSNLNIDKSYKQEYIPFTSCTIPDQKNIGLERAVTGVTVSQASGQGLLNLEANDILEVNGKRYTIGAGGNLSEHSDTVGKVNFTFKVENGKFRIRIDEYGIRITQAYPLTLKVTREDKELNGSYQRMNHTMNIKVPYVEKISGESLLEVKEYYPSPEYIAFNSCNLSSPTDIALENALRDVKLTQTTGKGLVTLEHNDILEVNGKQYTIGFDGNLPEKHDTLGNINFKFKVENGKFRLALKDWGVLEPNRLLTIKAKRATEILDHKMTLRVPRKIEGTSTLTFKEYYPTPSYVEFNGCTLANPQALALENSLRDVYLESSNRHGILLAEQGDKIEVNGKQYVIGAGGNLTEQTGTIGNINFKFKVENKKFRLALTSWGILEPKRDLVVRIIRATNEVSKHTIGITSPRRVEGTSTLKFTEKYPIRDIVRFQGISLTAPNIGGIEPPIPAGVSYKSNDGYGIPFMKEGDILEVQCETMRATQKYIIDSKNSLKHQTIDLPGTVLSLLVEDGKLRLGLNNWLVNKNTVLNFRVIRGVNEISNTSITLEVPKAPFDMLKNGILDFGKLIQGSKNKKAETSILLEMHQDISNVKFSLSTTTPELVNSSGATLHARDLQAGVQKQGKKRHLVRIIGRLDVPEKQELGVYRGSVLLNVTIK
nr:hypothetical protein [uncultured Fusobacterium sp.]